MKTALGIILIFALVGCAAQQSSVSHSQSGAATNLSDHDQFAGMSKEQIAALLTRVQY